eukprot:COSAG02_NODE_43934_length_370_cov_0.926199_1_plen_66_part_10
MSAPHLDNWQRGVPEHQRRAGATGNACRLEMQMRPALVGLVQSIAAVYEVLPSAAVPRPAVEKTAL